MGKVGEQGEEWVGEHGEEEWVGEHGEEWVGEHGEEEWVGEQWDDRE